MARPAPGRRVLGWVVVVSVAVWYYQTTFTIQDVSDAQAPLQLEAWTYKDPKVLPVGAAGRIEYDLRNRGAKRVTLLRFEPRRRAGLNVTAISRLAEGGEVSLEGTEFGPGQGARVMLRFTATSDVVYYPSRVYLEYRQGLRTFREKVEVRYP